MVWHFGENSQRYKKAAAGLIFELVSGDEVLAYSQETVLARYSNTYQKYSDQAQRASRWWYAATLVSLVFLIGLSIWWFVFNKYGHTDYIQLIARICASVGFAVVSRYSAIQASKNKVMETKLRKIQLQMATFDAFVASLDKEEQDKFKKNKGLELLKNDSPELFNDKNLKIKNIIENYQAKANKTLSGKTFWSTLAMNMIMVALSCYALNWAHPRINSYIEAHKAENKKVEVA